MHRVSFELNPTQQNGECLSVVLLAASITKRKTTVWCLPICLSLRPVFCGWLSGIERLAAFVV